MPKQTNQKQSAKNKKKSKKKQPSLQSTQKPNFVPKIPTRPIRQTGYFDIDKYSHHFVIRNISPIGQQLLIKFATNYIQWGFAGFGRFAKRVAVKTFGARVRPLNHYHFHRGQWSEFVRFLSNAGIDIKNITVQEYGYYEPVLLNKPFTTDKTPRPLQVPVIDYFLSDSPSKFKLAEVQTGGGKTLMASNAISKLNTRFVMFIKPQFIVKWISDVQELLGIERDEVCVIQGSDSLIATIHGVMSGELNPKAIIVSNRTFQTWIKNYEERGNDITEIYGCTPPEFIQALRCGVRLVDEVHLDFHLNFKIDLYTHVERSISLSATLISDDAFISRMQVLAYPMHERYAGTPYIKYIDCYGVKYSVEAASRLAQVGPTGQYSHNAFEKSIMENRKLLQSYLSFIERLVNDHYFNREVDGDKCLIYCSSIAMCTLVTEFLKISFPDKDVRRYVEHDPYINLLEADICVSTVQSAGTGHDIPGLITVILTHSLNSSASNIQGFGRLRNLAGKEMVFVFIACAEVGKHMDYYDNKIKLLKELAQTLKETRIYEPIDRE